MKLELSAPLTPSYSYDGIELPIRMIVTRSVFNPLLNRDVEFVSEYSCELVHAYNTLWMDFKCQVEGLNIC